MESQVAQAGLVLLIIHLYHFSAETIDVCRHTQMLIVQMLIVIATADWY